VDDRYEREREFHDELAEGKSRPADRFYAVNESSWTYFRELLLREAERARREGDGKILEYGSGIGSYSSLALAEAGYPALGIDISPGSVQAATERARREFPDVPIEYRAMNAAYSEVARVLKPSGTALFAEPLGHNPLINLYRRLTPEQRTDDEHPLKLADIELARRWFGGVEARYFHLFVLLATPLRSTRVFTPVRRALDAVDRGLFGGVAPSRRLAWYVVLRLTRPGAGSAPRP
jgi:SAM-dependent methyltransferase